jgi:DNA-binding CsgD family transcriptional regulator
MRRESKNSRRKVTAAENQVKTLRMVIAGVSRADIARQLGVSRVTVGKYIESAMEEMKAERFQLATQAYDIEYQRNEAMIRAVVIKATDPRNVSLNHLDRFMALAQRQTVLTEKRIATQRGTSSHDTLTPEEAARIAGLIPYVATEAEREAIKAGDRTAFAAVVARIRETKPL